MSKKKLNLTKNLNQTISLNKDMSSIMKSTNNLAAYMKTKQFEDMNYTMNK